MTVEGCTVGVRLDTGPFRLSDPAEAAKTQGKDTLFRRRC